MKKYLISCAIVFGALALVLGGLVFVKGRQFTAMAQAGGPPQFETVSSFMTERQSWRPFLSSVGSLAAVQGVTIQTELSGKVEEILFESGESAEAGEVLLKLDTSVEDADLESAEANLRLARLQVERFRRLVAEDATPQSRLDQAEAEFDSARARVNNLKAIIAKKTVKAPFSGELGIRQVNLGEFLSPGMPVVPLQSFDPIYVNFSLPQRHLDTVKRDLPVEVRTEAVAGDVAYKGKVTAINPEVNPRTRNIQLQATLDNPNKRLRPGAFVRVRLLMPEDRPVVAIPLTAVLNQPYGDSVYLIEEEKGEDGEIRQVVRQKFVRTGDKRGDFVEVVEGLEPGVEVASSGLFKLRNGQTVRINNDVKPDAKRNPDPENA
jgi:membrane fusion protein (multidrug efflux system)